MKTLIELLLENKVTQKHNTNAVRSGDCWYSECQCGFRTTSPGLMEHHLRTKHDTEYKAK